MTEKQKEKMKMAVLEEMRKQYPAMTSGDLQTAVLAMTQLLNRLHPSEIRYATGICCGCQTEVPLTLYEPDDEELGMEDGEMGRPPDSTFFHVTVAHSAYGEMCNGSGCCPQCVVNEEVKLGQFLENIGVVGSPFLKVR